MRFAEKVWAVSFSIVALAGLAIGFLRAWNKGSGGVLVFVIFVSAIYGFFTWMDWDMERRQ